MTRRAHQLADRLGHRTPAEILLEMSSRGPACLPPQGSNIDCVFLPSYYFLQFEDIPLHFRVTGFDDPRLQDEQFLQGFWNWLKSAMQINFVHDNAAQFDRYLIREVLVGMQNPALWEGAKDFLLAHEISHRIHLHQEQEHQFLADANRKYYLTGALVIGCLTCLCMLVGFGLELSIIVAVASGAVGLTLCSMPCYLFYNETYKFFHRGKHSDVEQLGLKRQQEKEADISAIRACQTADGGVYFFNVKRAINLRFYPGQSTPQGDDPTDLHHPPLSERVTYLRAALPR